MAQDNKSNLPPIEDLGQPEFIQSIISMAMGNKSPDPAKVEKLGLGLPNLARDYRRIFETEKRGTSVSKQLGSLARIRDAAARLNAELADVDGDSEEWLWRASDEIKRRREDKQPRYERDRCGGDRRGPQQPQTNTRLTRGVSRIGKIHNGVSELATTAAFAVSMIGATPGAKGGSVVVANVADVRYGAAGEIGDIFRWLTGERPKRSVLHEEREDLAEGQQSIEAGPWYDFLGAIMEKIFGDRKGVIVCARKVVEGMSTNPDQYRASSIHFHD